MKLKPNVINEYKQRHDDIWPELVALLHEHVSSNTISSNDKLRENEIMQRWWKHMADLMETNIDQSPITHPLKLVFHMD
ncbi:unnamed protein product [Rotaria sp. Silwood1]|nr:unnamed protein product [Rotaria sp. Silwood1]CAF3632590.1 unnamed protein product [Rotaria sp. Silwood1]CAF3644576.1 unnamed protein product [Rotaria sp. Silwood1]